MLKRNELVFIDTNVDQPEYLAALVKADIETVLLDASKPALAQIAEIAAARPSAPEAIHIFAHGSPASIDFAGGSVTTDSISSQQKYLAQIGAALADNGSMQLWSCDVAASDAGRDFLQTLSDELGHPVAGSSRLIGAPARDGAWSLDVVIGQTNATLPLRAGAELSYAGVFAVYNATTSNDFFAMTTTNDSLVVSSSTQMQSGDLFDGAAGIDTIMISALTGGNIDLRAPVASVSSGFKNIEAVSFNNTSGYSQASFNASQFGTGYISNALAVNGTALSQTVAVMNANNFSAAAWTFTNWTSGTDMVYIYGTSGNDTLVGSTMADYIVGEGGNDTMSGGLGNDQYVVYDAGDVITENVGAGTDIVIANISYTLGANVENLLLTANWALNGTGNALNNTLTGNVANNILDGGAGIDTLNGGTGDDTYVVDSQTDVIWELVGQGTDTISSSVSYNLTAANVENLTLTGIDNISGSGNSGNNVITGNSANNLLNGGLGADTLAGGTGNDSYLVDADDTIIENVDSGHDSVLASFTYTLGSNLEQLNLMGSANINGTGNGLDNIILGGLGANTLTGLGGNDTLEGGAGADVLIGGLGDDTYVYDALDTITENAGEGTDTIQSAVTYTLTNTNLENVTLTGAALINATGHAGNNVLIGNSAVNYLYALDGNDTLDGKLGADIMVGGAGDDIYYVDSKLDMTAEYALGGNDTVYASVAHVMKAEVENLVLTGVAGLAGTGNELNNTITGNAGGNAIDGKLGADTMIGGRGNDVYIVDNAGDVVVELADEGVDHVKSSISYTLVTAVDKLTLTGTAAINGTGNSLNNILVGNTAANTLYGYDGDDELNGGLGADQMVGGLGDDLYFVDNFGDVVTEVADQGTDKVSSSITYTLGVGVENLILTGSLAINGAGNASDNEVTGNKGANILYGYDGNDKINGGLGADRMFGGLGDDTYVVDQAGDLITENLGEGTDLVESAVTHTLGANLENLTLTGSKLANGGGNALNNIIIGNSANNTLSGLAGNDHLDGGKGVDTMAGGQNDDTYIVDNILDVVQENSGEGFDSVTTSVSWVMGANVEELILAGAAKINGTGNATDNVIRGNVGINILSGLAGNDTLDGGYGADTLIGGLGNDIYYVDSTAEIVTELAGGGTDTVNSKVTFTLSAEVENLTLIDDGSIDGTGNALANILIGNSGNNTLNGAAGADTMTGGDGNDTYIVDNTSDVITEVLDQGYDRVESSATFTLGANVEELTLTGTSAVNGTGNASNNELNGNTAANVLVGGAGLDEINGDGGADTITGGLDQDTLSGGSGNDTFVYTALLDSKLQTAPGGGTFGVDVITDFTSGDKINMSAIDANAVSAGDQAFVFDTNGTPAAGEVVVTFANGLNTVNFHIDGDLVADMTIVVASAAALTASDFIL